MPSQKSKGAEGATQEQARILPAEYSLSKLLFGNQAMEFTRMRQVVANSTWLQSCLSSIAAQEAAAAALLKKARSKIPACPSPATQGLTDVDPRTVLDQRIKLSAQYVKDLKAQVIAPLSKATAAGSKQLAALDKEHNKAYAQLNKLRTASDKASSNVLKLYDQAKRLDQMEGLDPKNKAKAQAALAKAHVADGRYKAEVTKVMACEETLDAKVTGYLEALEKLDLSMCESYNQALQKYAELTAAYFAAYQDAYKAFGDLVAAKDPMQMLITFATANRSKTGNTMRTTVYKDLSGSLGPAPGATTAPDTPGSTMGDTKVVPEPSPAAEPLAAEPAPAASPAPGAPLEAAAEPAPSPDPAGDEGEAGDPDVVSAPVPAVSEAAGCQASTAYDVSLQGTVKASVVVE